jgi:ubiquinone/menaquinone biosynthesis C-methylase UbiE
MKGDWNNRAGRSKSEEDNMKDDVHPDYAAITERQKETWATGDFHEISRQIMPISEALCQAADPHAGQRVLDVACGSGNTALVAARRYCDVTGIDYVPALIERAKIRNVAEKLDIDFRVADAQALPFPDASFDTVLSVFGVMFAPDQEKAASELLRVCRPGGAIGLANWMPEDFGQDFFGAHARHVPPPPGLTPPQRWGTDTGLQELLGAGTRSIESEKRTNRAYMRSMQHAVEEFRTYFGPTSRACETLDAEAQKSLMSDIETVFRRYNEATDGTVILAYQYLQTIAVRK